MVLSTAAIIILCITYPDDKGVQEFCAVVWFVWECVFLFLWYREYKKGKNNRLA